MRKHVLAVMSGVLAICLVGATAFAHPNTYTVSVSGSTSPAAHRFFATADAPIDFTVWNGSVATPMDCQEVNLEGEVTSGSGVDPVGVVKAVTRTNTPETFSHSEWKTCVSLGILPMTVVPLNNWEIHPTGTGVTSALTNVVPGYVSGPSNGALRAHVYATSGGPSGTSCNFVVEGRADGSFNEATQKLTITETGFSGDLTIVNASGADCLGLVPDGADANFEGVFTIGSDTAGNTKSGITQFLSINLISSP